MKIELIRSKNTVFLLPTPILMKEYPGNYKFMITWLGFFLVFRFKV